MELLVKSKYPFIDMFLKLARHAQINRAVAYGLINNGWRLLSGPVSMFLIGTYFTPELQGYYFTFGSLMALQSFIELGLGIVILQFASHEWSKLRLDSHGRIAGDSEALSRLISLGRLSAKWYLVGSIIFALAVGSGGFIFFSMSPNHGVSWIGPWFMLCFLTGITFFMTPLWSILEGCNQVQQVYYFRMVQGVISVPSIWIAIVLGAGLWTASISIIVSTVWAVTFLVKRYSYFFQSFWSSTLAGAKINWRSEILPMQWRLAVSHLTTYFGSYFIMPVLFHYAGATGAGQFGMSYTLAGAIGSIAAIWASTRAPQFGMLIARKNYTDLDRLLKKIWIMSTIILIAGSITFWLFVHLLTEIKHPFAMRLLPPLPTVILLIGLLASMVWHPMSVYLRAHKREPFMLLSTISGLSMGLLVWQLGSRFGVMGGVFAYAGVNALISFPFGFLIWYRCRAKWHRETT